MENMHAEMRIKQILTSKMWLAGSSLYIPIAKTITKMLKIMSVKF